MCGGRIPLDSGTRRFGESYHLRLPERTHRRRARENLVTEDPYQPAYTAVPGFRFENRGSLDLYPLRTWRASSTTWQGTQRRRLQEDPPEYRTPHEVPVTASRRRPPDFRRYNGRIPHSSSSQTFTVLPTKQVGATIIIAPGTSLRSLANVTLKAQQNGQVCEERIRRARGPGAVAGYRAPREFLPYRSASVLRKCPANRVQIL